MNKNLFIGVLIVLLTASCSERVKTEDFSNNDIVGIWIQDAAIPDLIRINDDGTGENNSFMSGRMNWSLEDDKIVMNEVGRNDWSKTYIIDSIVVDTYDDKVLKGKRKMMYVRQKRGDASRYDGWLETSGPLTDEQMQWLRSEEGQAWLNSYDDWSPYAGNKGNAIDWMLSETGIQWLNSADGKAWLSTPQGIEYVEQKRFYHWKYVQLSEKELKNL